MLWRYIRNSYWSLPVEFNCICPPVIANKGFRSSKDCKKSFNPYIGCERWLKKAAEQNYIYAEELLADKYYEGVYIVKDVKAAIYWYEKAANQGSVYAMYRAGYIYYSEPIDYNKAGQWFSLAAEKGDKDAEEVLRNNLRYNRFTKKWDAVR